MRSLYVTQTGMAENLGQSQVLPYLRGLVRRGADVRLISYELGTLPATAREEIAARMRRDGIRWHPLVRKMPGPLLVKMKESAQGLAAALVEAASWRPDIVHGRSYFATAICDAARQVTRAKVLFDCRGMLGDEYVDAGYWTTDRIEYRLLKTYEKRLFKQADGIVVLTRALANWLKETRTIGDRPALEVIPCCVDLDRFKPSEEIRAAKRAELDLGDAFTIVYSGSLGNWYLEEEMARFAATVRLRAKRAVKVVAFSPSDPTKLKAQLADAGFEDADVVVRKVAPADIAAWLCVGDIGLSFIQSCFSKKGSSPTKVAEYLACGLIAVVNGDIGDQSDLRSEESSSVVLDGFTDSELGRGADKAIALGSIPYRDRAPQVVAAARRRFGLEEVGIERYARLYERLIA